MEKELRAVFSEHGSRRSWWCWRCEGRGGRDGSDGTECDLRGGEVGGTALRSGPLSLCLTAGVNKAISFHLFRFPHFVHINGCLNRVPRKSLPSSILFRVAMPSILCLGVPCSAVRGQGGQGNIGANSYCITGVHFYMLSSLNYIMFLQKHMNC